MKLALFLLSTALAVMPARAAITEFWVYEATNLLVPEQVAATQEIIKKSAACGATHLLLTDSKFGRLAEMDARYFKNAEAVKQTAKDAGIEIVPAVCPIGYSDALLIHDPNLIEAIPVKDAPLVVGDGGEVFLVADPDLKLKASDMSDLNLWGFKDEAVTSQAGMLRIADPNGKNARISQKLKVKPWRQYHAAFRVKTDDFKATLEAKFISISGLVLNHDYLKVAKTQDWKTHHVVFNSQDSTEVGLYLGAWGGKTGEALIDDLTLEEVAFVNLVRRPGAPISITTADGKLLVEGKDFEPLSDPLMGTKPYNGCYDVWHAPPILKMKPHIAKGTKLLASWHHAATVHDGQAGICPSEPRSLELIRDEVKRVNDLFSPKGFMMSHDEIRVWNQCAACRERNLTAGRMLADNVKFCISTIREISPKARIYVWSDMFDPHHNAKDNFYLARGSFAESWEGLDKDVVIIPWYLEKAKESLQFFAERGHDQVIAGYYDSDPAKVEGWLQAAKSHVGVKGIMYTTWENNYSDMEKFFQLVGAEGR